jgi:hypothetical protein
MNAYDVKDLLAAAWGIEVPKLGCVMLDIAPIDVTALIPEEWAFVSTNPDHHWINGLNAGDHITLLYGLLDNANDIRDAVDLVLKGWQPGQPWIEHIGSFPSTFEDEPYVCIVGHLALTPELLDAHARLSLLPHIDTHPQYRPHLTLGYVKVEHRDDVVALLDKLVKPRLTPRGLNYGRKPVAAEPVAAETQVVDLVAALRASIEAAKKRREARL